MFFIFARKCLEKKIKLTRVLLADIIDLEFEIYFYEMMGP